MGSLCGDTMSEDLPFISVVMPIRNEAFYISRTLAQVVDQNYPRDKFEILVVDGMSEDNTRSIVGKWQSKYAQIRLLENGKRLSASGRNVGFKCGKGEIFVVVDGHCYIPSEQMLRDIARCLLTSGTDCLGRPQPLDPPDITDFQKAVAFARASRIGHARDSLIHSDYEGYASPRSNGAIYDKKVFEKVGYVDESFDACEDVEFNYRVEKAGLKSYTSPAVTVKYYPRETLGALFKQMKRYGSGRYRLLDKHPETISFSGLIPALFVSGYGVLLLLSLVGDYFLYTFCLAYTIYFLTILAYSLHISFKHGFRYLLYLIPIYLVIHFGLGWGFLQTLLRNMFQIKKFDKIKTYLAKKLDWLSIRNARFR